MPRQACSYESAAVNNPHRNIFIVHLSPFGIEKDISEHSDTIQALLEYPNIHFRNVKLNDLYKDTILENWKQQNLVYKTKYIEQSSDLARILLLHKYGGTYVDSDVIITKNLSELHSDWIAFEYAMSINNAVMDFSYNGPGNLVTYQCLKYAKQ